MQHKLLRHKASVHEKPHPLPYDLLGIDKPRHFVSKQQRSAATSSNLLKIISSHGPRRYASRRSANERDDCFIIHEIIPITEEIEHFITPVVTAKANISRSVVSEIRDPPTTALVINTIDLNLGTSARNVGKPAEPVVNRISLPRGKGVSKQLTSKIAPQRFRVSQHRTEPLNVVLPKHYTSSLKSLSAYFDSEASNTAVATPSIIVGEPTTTADVQQLLAPCRTKVLHLNTPLEYSISVGSTNLPTSKCQDVSRSELNYHNTSSDYVVSRLSAIEVYSNLERAQEITPIKREQTAHDSHSVLSSSSVLDSFSPIESVTQLSNIKVHRALKDVSAISNQSRSETFITPYETVAEVSHTNVCAEQRSSQSKASEQLDVVDYTPKTNSDILAQEIDTLLQSSSEVAAIVSCKATVAKENNSKIWTKLKQLKPGNSKSGTAKRAEQDRVSSTTSGYFIHYFYIYILYSDCPQNVGCRS